MKFRYTSRFFHSSYITERCIFTLLLDTPNKQISQICHIHLTPSKPVYLKRILISPYLQSDLTYFARFFL
jgi:hypothetical protein